MSRVKRLAVASSLPLFLAALLLLLLFISFAAEFTVSSDKARRILTQQINIFTQREVIIDGDVAITVSLLPQLIVKRIHVKNAEGPGDDDFITVSEVRVRVALLPLLTGTLRLEEFYADRATINMVKEPDGSNNWSFDHLLRRTEPMANGQVAIKGGKDRATRLTIGEIGLTDITIRHTDKELNRTFEKHLSSLVVDFEDDDRVVAAVSGKMHAYPYSLSFESDPMDKLIGGELWHLKGTGQVADSETLIEAGIQLGESDINGTASLDAKDINIGKLLELFGIVSGEKAASESLTIAADIKGQNLQDAVKESELELVLEDGYWTGKVLSKNEIRTLQFARAGLLISWKKPVEIKLDGNLSGEPVNIHLKSNLLKEFFDDVDKLAVDLEASIADSEMRLKGILDLPLNAKRYQMDLSMKGAELERLNRLFSSDFPPFNDYALVGVISSNDNGFSVRADDATIGDTNFKAAIVVDTRSVKPFWSIDLDSTQLNIHDFEIYDIQSLRPSADIAGPSRETEPVFFERDPWQQLKQVIEDPDMHLDLNIKAGKVVAGDSTLGSSSLKLKLRDNALILEDFELDLPNGKIRSAASFSIDNGNVTGDLKLDMEKFDYGVVVRYVMPGSKQSGIISTRIDLELEGQDFERLLDGANGKLDVAVWPAGTKSKVFDIWATNLFLLILPEIRKDESRLNCMVALMDIEDGVMKEDFFGIDTTKVWLYGNITVNFPEEHVKLSLFPNSKTARLFAVQAPIRAEGRFDNLKLNTNPIDITVAYLSFITSPLHVPARRLFGDKVPEDASEGCERFFSREYVERLKKKIDAEIQKDVDEWLDSD
jgi:uncharacterized protein involved in outer membrane biogenesis